DDQRGARCNGPLGEGPVHRPPGAVGAQPHRPQAAHLVVGAQVHDQSPRNVRILSPTEVKVAPAPTAMMTSAMPEMTSVLAASAIWTLWALASNTRPTNIAASRQASSIRPTRLPWLTRPAPDGPWGGGGGAWARTARKGDDS